VARAPVAPWAAWLRGGGAAVATLLVVGGALLALRESTSGRGRAARAWLRVAATGTVLFAIAVLVGGLAASWQATGDLLRDVPPAWWLALLLWLPLLVLALRTRAARALPAPGESAPPGPPGRRTATAAAVLSIGGALAALLGLGGLV
jgi:cytochrome bd-type quinol oxidase subunit 2